MAGQLLLGLSILVFVHELGHFVAARMFGIRVDKFYLFFDAGGFRLFHFKIGETDYGIGWLPLGGYCKIAGMVDESMDKENLKKAPQPWEYRSKPAWQRLIVVSAGVIMNLLTGIFIFTGILLHDAKGFIPTEEVNKNGIYAYAPARQIGFRTGDKILGTKKKVPERFYDAFPNSILLGGKIKVLRDGKTLEIEIPSNTYKQLAADSTRLPFLDFSNHPLIVDTAVPGYPAHEAGIRSGDRIIRVNDLPVPTFGAFKETVAACKNLTVPVLAVRQGDTLGFEVTVNGNGMVGILARTSIPSRPYTVSNALKYGTLDAFDLLRTNIRGLGKIFNGEEKASESVSGPIGIATIYGATWNWPRFWYITGMLSLVLAFMNILPVPGLDGGHFLFTLYELTTRRKVSDKVLETAQMIGMGILFALIIWVFANDIFKLFR